MDRSQQLSAEIAQLQDRYNNLGTSDEFCYLNDQLRILGEQKEKFLLQFRITKAFLDNWNRLNKRVRSQPNTAAFVARLRTNKFLAALKKDFDQSPELTTHAMDRYFAARDISESHMRQLIQADLKSISEELESVSRKQSVLTESFDATRRELKKTIEAKRQELKLVSIASSLTPVSETIIQPPIDVTTPPQITIHRRRKKKPNSPTELSFKKEPLWEFFLEGQTNPLPRERAKFLAEINRATWKELPRFKGGQLYNWLMAIAHQMTIGERETKFSKVGDPGGPYDGWKDLSIGDYHAFLRIDDSAKTITVKLVNRSVFEDIYRRS